MKSDLIISEDETKQTKSRNECSHPNSESMWIARKNIQLAGEPNEKGEPWLREDVGSIYTPTLFPAACKPS